MTQVEFKEILESIEEGLYGKWLVNFLNDDFNKNANLEDWIKSTPNHDLIDDAFYWDDTIERHDFWKRIEDQLIIERDKRNLE